MSETVDQLQPSWLSEAEQQAWRAVHRLRGPLLASLGRQLSRDAGLSLSDYEVLVALSESPDGIVHVRDLLRSTDWEASRLSHHLTRMQARGLVSRQQCRSDARSSEVVLTEAGRVAIEAAAPAHVAAVRSTFIDLLTEDQLRTLADIDRVLAARLAAEDPADDGTAAAAVGDCGLTGRTS